MKKLVALLLVSMMASVAVAGLDPDPDSFGVYFDDQGNSNCMPAGMPMFAPTSVYIVFMNTTAPLKGFELSYEIVGLPATMFRTGSVVLGGSNVDLGNSAVAGAGDYRCGYAAARPASTALAVAQWTFLNTSADPGLQFYIRGVATSPSIPGGLPVVDNGESLRQTGVASGSVNLPVAGTGPAYCPVSEEISSFGAVKGLFR